jgi:hypothetical protein
MNFSGYAVDTRWSLFPTDPGQIWGERVRLNQG